jgi:hypothetical protein
MGVRTGDEALRSTSRVIRSAPTRAGQLQSAIRSKSRRYADAREQPASSRPHGGQRRRTGIRPRRQGNPAFARPFTGAGRVEVWHEAPRRGARATGARAGALALGGGGVPLVPGPATRDVSGRLGEGVEDERGVARHSGATGGRSGGALRQGICSLSRRGAGREIVGARGHRRAGSRAANRRQSPSASRSRRSPPSRSPGARARPERPKRALRQAHDR